MAAVVVPVDLTPMLPAARTLTAADLDGLVEELAAYHAHFAPLFRRPEQRAWAEVYLRGLLTAGCPLGGAAQECRGAGAAAAGSRAGRRPARPGLAAPPRGHPAGRAAGTTRACWRRIGGWSRQRSARPMACCSSTATRRPSRAPTRSGWRGTAQGAPGGHSGKQDNCQAGVFLGYASRQGYTLLDRRLYLPAAWFTAAYADRRWACRIPRGTAFQTKHALAGDLVEAAVAAGTLRARWVVADEGYGDSPALLDRWAATGLWYLAEVARDTQAWCLAEPDGQTPRARPTCWVPPRAASGKGPLPTKQRLAPASPAPQRVDDWAALVPAARWQRYRLLEGSKGPLVAAFVAVRVVMVRDRLPGPEGWLLVRRTVPDAGAEAEYKYYLSNASAETPLGELVRVSGMRWPIEACFAEGRQELGLDHDETRSWPGHPRAGRAPPSHPRPARASFPGPAATAARPESGGPAHRTRCRSRRPGKPRRCPGRSCSPRCRWA